MQDAKYQDSGIKGLGDSGIDLTTINNLKFEICYLGFNLV
jgi:hypothetical protein